MLFNWVRARQAAGAQWCRPQMLGQLADTSTVALWHWHVLSCCAQLVPTLHPLLLPPTPGVKLRASFAHPDDDVAVSCFGLRELRQRYGRRRELASRFGHWFRRWGIRWAAWLQRTPVARQCCVSAARQCCMLGAEQQRGLLPRQASAPLCISQVIAAFAINCPLPVLPRPGLAGWAATCGPTTRG